MWRTFEEYLSDPGVDLATRIVELFKRGVLNVDARRFLFLAEVILEHSDEKARGRYSELVNKLEKRKAIATSKIRGLNAG